MEKVVARQIIGFLNYHNLLYKHQYGFRANHNCSHPVLHFADKIYNALNQKPSAATLAIFINKVRRAAKILHYYKQFKNYSRNIKETWYIIREVIGTKKKSKFQIFLRIIVSL